MPRKATPSFTHEFRLKTQPWKTRKALKKLNATRDLYNGCLGEGFKRLNTLRKDPRFDILVKEYQVQAKIFNPINIKFQELKKNKLKITKELEAQYKIEKTKRDEISSKIKELEKEYGFTQGDLQKFSTNMKNNSYMKDHLDGNTPQIISDRAFHSLDKYRYGKMGRPRFKSKEKGLKSIQGKANTCLRFTKQGKFKWLDLEFDVIYDQIDKYGVQAHALSCNVKYVRFVHKFKKGKDCFYMQLILEGIPKEKSNYSVKDGVVGLDIGVSTIAAFGEEKALLSPLCDEIEPIHQYIRQLQRKSSRKLRLNNPQNFDKNNAIIKGKKTWIKSNSYLNLQNDIKEKHTKLANKRKNSQYLLVKEVLSMGNNLHIEKNNYKAWSKGLFGKTIAHRAPSQFESLLTRKALHAGGEVKWIDPWSAKLSQYDHVSNTYVKKSLGDRIHLLGDNKTIVQRDLYSAALAYAYDFDKKLVDNKEMKISWTSFDTRLKVALLTLHKQYTNSKNKGLYPSCLRDKKLLSELDRIATRSLVQPNELKLQSNSV